MRVRVTRKFAEQIDGVDLSKVAVGDVIDLPERQARTLIAEGWGEAYRPETASGSRKVLAFSRDGDRRDRERDDDDVSRAS